MAFTYGQDYSEFGPGGASPNQKCKVYLVHNGTRTLQGPYLQESICCFFFALINSPLKPSAVTRVRALVLTFSSPCWVLSAIKPIHLVCRWEISVCAPGSEAPPHQLRTFPAARTQSVRKAAPPWFPLELTPTVATKEATSLAHFLRQFHFHHQHL